MNVRRFDVPEMTPLELKERMDNHHPIVLVDVREPREYAIADLPHYDPVRIPVGEIVQRMDELSRDDNVVVYCRSGQRSAWAVNQLIQAGFDKVYNLEGGILRWRNEIDPSLTLY